MRRPSIIQQLVIGLFLGLVIWPQMPANQVQAQWVVDDPRGWTQRFYEYIKEAERWVKTVEHYGDMVDKAAKQVTSLGGILDHAEKIVARNNRLVATMSRLGQSVRGVFALKRQIEAMVHYRIQALRNIDDRVRNGIFNPEAIKADFEEYLKDSIGRKSQERIATLETIANMDTLLSRWQDELMYKRGQKAGIIKQQEEAEQKLEEELAKPEAERCDTCVSHLRDEISDCEAKIIVLDGQISTLTDQIERRLKEYNLEMTWRGEQAHDIQQMEEAWDGFYSVKEDVIKKVEDYSYGDESQPQN